jgi:N-acyl-phosphatidylethanolamine-hydrolysing phospholipase D
MLVEEPTDVALNQSYAHLVARVLVRPLLGTWVRPNHITVLRMAVGLGACALLATGIPVLEFWSGILWLVTCLLDRADGELARIGDMRSELGKVLDFYSDLILDSAWFLAIGFALRHSSLGRAAIPLGVLTCVSMLLCIGMAELFERESEPGVKTFYGLKRFHPDDALFLLALFIWLHVLPLVLIAASICTPVIAAVITIRYGMARKRVQPGPLASRPVSKHHTHGGFRNNYVASVTRTLPQVLRWQYQRIIHRLPPEPRLEIPRIAADLDFLSANASAGRAMIPAVTWIGHASMLVQASGLNILTDPIFSTRASPFTFMGPVRAQLPGVALAALPRIDVVVISHNHYDHLDKASILSLARQSGGAPLFLVPLGLKKWMATLGIDSAVELDWWESHTHRAESAGGASFAPVEFVFTPAQHWSQRGVGDRNKTLWGSWSVFGADFHWFFTGDTGYSHDFIDIRERFAERQARHQGGGFDIALVAVGACLPRWFMRLQHVDLDEAVQVHLDLGAKLSVGVHWGTFELADDPLDQPLHDLAAARSAKGVDAESFFLIPIGATRKLGRRPASMNGAP